MISSTYAFVVLSKRVLTIPHRSRYHPAHRLPYSTMTRLVVTPFFPLPVLTLPEPPSPGSSTHAPEGVVLPSGSSRDIPQLSVIEPVSPPQDAVPKEHLSRTETSRGLLRWLPKMKRNKDRAVDKPDRLPRESDPSDPQSRSQSPTRVNAISWRMAAAQRQPVSTLGTRQADATNLTRDLSERLGDRP